MRTRYRVDFLILLAVALLAGCASPTITPTPSAEHITPITPTATPTRTPTEPQATFTPTPLAPTLTPSPVEPTSTSTLSLPPEEIMIYRPFDIAPSLPLDARPAGVLLVWKEHPQLLHFDPQGVEDIPGIDTGCLSTSPDGNWLAYCPLSDDSPTGRWLIVESADRQQKKKVPMDIHLIYFGDYEWLDNQHLIFPLIRQEFELRPMVVINPFTGEQTELTSDYPDIVHTSAGPVGRMNFNLSDVVYDPSLNLVIFPVRRSPKNYIVLWDRQSNSILAEVEEKGEFLHYPIWSPDSTRFAVAVVISEPSEHIVYDWFIVSREGQVERLTYFGDYFTNTQISDGNWSPDGQKLAFWLETDSGLCPGTNLAVLEVATRLVTNTCIPGTLEYAPPPIWSLDSRYIAVRNAVPNPDQYILIDFEHGLAYDITVYGVPIGWLALP
jgi:hypothetical protein